MEGKMRIHELAKELQTTSKELIQALSHLGIEGKSPSSSLDKREIAKVRADMAKGKPHPAPVKEGVKPKEVKVVAREPVEKKKPSEKKVKTVAPPTAVKVAEPRIEEKVAPPKVEAKPKLKAEKDKGKVIPFRPREAEEAETAPPAPPAAPPPEPVIAPPAAPGAAPPRGGRGRLRGGAPG